MSLRIIFMGTPDFAVPALRALIESNHQVVAVYTQPPRPAGRGMDLKKSPVHQIAEEHGIPVFTPENFKDPKDIADFENQKADLAVVAAYGHLLPDSILNAPNHGCINIHASLLPKFRGAAPIQRTIQSGAQQSGNSVIQMVGGMDAGPIIIKEAFTLEDNETAGTLHNKLKDQAAEIILKAIHEFVEERKKPTPQKAEEVTFANKIKKEDARIDWSKTAVEIDRHVRAFNPWPGAFFLLGGKRVRVLKGEVENYEGDPGKALDNELLFGCGENAYRILSLQKEGKKPMASDEFLRGQAVPKGTSLQLP